MEEILARAEKCDAVARDSLMLGRCRAAVRERVPLGSGVEITRVGK